MSDKLPTSGAEKYRTLHRTPTGLQWGYVGDFPHLMIEGNKPTWSDGVASNVEGLPPLTRDGDVLQIIDDSGSPIWTTMRFQ
jgi:hypothetical protein